MSRLASVPALALVLLSGTACVSSADDGAFAPDTGGSGWTSCTRNADCPSGESCESGLCQPGTACLFDSACGYGQRCVDGRCVDRDEGCLTDADCTAQVGGVCDDGLCSYPAPVDCLADEDCPADQVCDLDLHACEGACPEGCDDGEPCTADTCSRDGCAHEAVADCCEDAAACDDDNPCTADACAENVCAHEPLEGAECCTADADCDDGDDGTVDRCVEYSCRHLESCEANSDCDDGDTCTADRCVAGGCVTEWVTGCCHLDADCDDDNDCTVDDCDGGACQHDGVPDCCATDADCEDGDPCTEDACGAGGTCTSQLVPDCCASDAECDDGVTCTADTCGADGECQNPWLPNCCTSAADCIDNDPCTTDSCGDGGLCTNPQVLGCCDDAADCDDGDTCTNESCNDGACVSVPDPSCCFADAECDDGDVCTADTCIDGGCLSAPIHDCCEVEADCDDGDAATTDVCDTVAHRCSHLGEACTQNAECDDGIEATIDVCDPVVHACRNEPRVTCAVDADCDDEDPCTLERCEASACEWQADMAVDCRCEAESECDPDETCGLFRFEDGGIWGYCTDAVGDLPMGARCAGEAASDTCRSGLCLDLLGSWVCYGACRTSAECAPGSTCQPSALPSGGGEPDHPQNVCLPDASSCQGDTDCPADMYCSAYPDPSDPGTVALGCVDVDEALGRTGEPCSVNSQCNSGFCLRDEAQGGICFGVCGGDDDCGDGQRCYEDFVTVTLSMGTADPSDDRVVPLPACAWDFGSITPCARETDCVAAEVCFPLLNADETDFEPLCVLPPAGTTLPPGAVCTAIGQCQSGVCVAGMETARCLQFCGTDADCLSPTTCETVDFTVTRLDGSTTNIPADVCVDD